MSYGGLARYLRGFDVCILPILINDLTLATNPVKAYEYLSAGKPIVSVDHPEQTAFDGLVAVAADRDAFLDALVEALTIPGDAAATARRRALAPGQTWSERAQRLLAATGALPAARPSRGQGGGASPPPQGSVPDRAASGRAASGRFSAAQRGFAGWMPAGRSAIAAQPAAPAGWSEGGTVARSDTRVIPS
jgi:hypothetical protein